MSTVTTDRYWAVDGYSLQSYAFNITSWGGDRQAPPSFRGENVTIPFRTGAAFVPKVVDERTMTLGMWVQGCNEDGSAPTTLDKRAQFEANWTKLRSLLWQPYRQIALSKRVVYPDGTLHTVTAQAQFAGGLNLSMTGSQRADFTVDLRLADPYFYGDPINVSVGTSSLVTVLGDARTTKITMSIPGPKSNPTIALATAGPSPYLRYNGTITNGSAVAIDVEAATATYYGDGVTQVRTGLVTNGNAFEWFHLDPGTVNVLSASGSFSMTYQPAFL